MSTLHVGVFKTLGATEADLLIKDSTYQVDKNLFSVVDELIVDMSFESLHLN